MGVGNSLGATLACPSADVLQWWVSDTCCCEPPSLALVPMPTCVRPFAPSQAAVLARWATLSPPVAVLATTAAVLVKYIGGLVEVGGRAGAAAAAAARMRDLPKPVDKHLALPAALWRVT